MKLIKGDQYRIPEPERMSRKPREVPVRLSAKLRQIREALRPVLWDGSLGEFSQNDMVRALGYSEEDGIYRTSISGYELGTRMPPYHVLLAYGRVANVFVEVLIDDLLDFEPGTMPYKVKSQGVPRLFW